MMALAGANPAHLPWGELERLGRYPEPRVPDKQDRRPVSGPYLYSGVDRGRARDLSCGCRVIPRVGSVDRVREGRWWCCDVVASLAVCGHARDWAPPWPAGTGGLRLGGDGVRCLGARLSPLARQPATSGHQRSTDHENRRLQPTAPWGSGLVWQLRVVGSHANRRARNTGLQAHRRARRRVGARPAGVL